MAKNKQKRQQYTVVTLTHGLLPAIKGASKILNENHRNKQFIGFKFCAILSSIMNSHADSLCPAWDLNPPFAQLIHTE